MKIRSLQTIIDKLPGVTEQSLIARVGDAIDSDKIRFNDDVRISGCLLVLEVISKQIERFLHYARAYRLGESDDNCEARSATLCLILCPVTYDRITHRLSSQSDRRLADLRAGDREHEGGCIAKVLDEIDGAGTFRQASDSAEFERDVVEFLADLTARHVLVQIYIDN